VEMKSHCILSSRFNMIIASSVFTTPAVLGDFDLSFFCGESFLST
jgi:hypothetical protein